MGREAMTAKYVESCVVYLVFSYRRQCWLSGSHPSASVRTTTLRYGQSSY